jgi:geranylgeranyl diphosphate synthase type II
MTPHAEHRISSHEGWRLVVEATLEDWLDEPAATETRLHSAMRYGVLGGGKRIRPLLAMAAAAAVGRQPKRALVPGCVIELIHAYSLIHDDLPAMDDDALRRGKPTVHVAFDEATAILAGDALQTLAFGVMSARGEFLATTRLQMLRELAQAAGAAGMVGGQALDLAAVGHPLKLAELEHMHLCKTGALIEASVKLGALAVETAQPWQVDALQRFGRALGLAFQVQDDLLDIEGSTDMIGKPQGSDAAREKPTFPTCLGKEGARARLQALKDETTEALVDFGDTADDLRRIADFVVTRTY